MREYRNALESAGYRPWMDETDLIAGRTLDRTLQEAMSSSCAAIFFITPRYQYDGYLKSEIDDALRQKVIRGNGFSIIPLLLIDETGKRGILPDPLKKYPWGEPETDIEGLTYIFKWLPPHLSSKRGYLPLDEVVPPTAKEVALVGQNLTSRVWLDQQRYSRFLSEIKAILSRGAIEKVVLVMMVPKALKAIHPGAAKHLRKYSLVGLEWLHRDLGDDNRITVVFHPSATLSLLAVDWGYNDSAFALITPKFQRTQEIDERVSILLNEAFFDSASMARMILDAKDNANDASTAFLSKAPELLNRLLEEAEL